ncbi:isoleucine--tRNA ligase [Candidatus Falkowbacteria bacterium]|nr:isoleucine--tRNA ligase [Candidatus Falkowbacteria bacterium]
MPKKEKQPSTNPFPKMEEKVLDFWEKGKIFEKSLRQAPLGLSSGRRQGEAFFKEYVFYDGPPFATGEPHYGHIVASLMKDVVPRYWTMRGFRVERKWGWDCHGLPIENIAEKELGVKRKKDIEEMGVEKFNEFCRSKVLGYVDVWKKIIRRLGRWADMENAYKTMDLDFMESIWWVFKELWNNGLIYEGYRSMHVCPRCETTLSQQEVAEGYKTIKDLSATVKFELTPTNQQILYKYTNKEKVYILAWTTTPWTLIGNVALAVKESIKYQVVSIKDNNEKYILAKDRIEEIFKNKEYEVIEEFEGKNLIGLKYKPLFDYYTNLNRNLASEASEAKFLQNGWKIYAADFVTTEEGTGVVHIAPAFGEDDMNLGKKEKLPFVQHVNMDGTIKKEAGEFAGLNVKPIHDSQETDVEIIKYLARHNLLFAKEKYEHSYPHCWRCETPLINYATSSWFVAVTKIKERALELAKNINWSPAHIKEGRFGNWLFGARDWSISRQRYWASVIPIWKCTETQNDAKRNTERRGKSGCGEIKVIRSVKELEELSGEKIIDLHKHTVDKITFSCKKCAHSADSGRGGVMRRVPDVLDCWFESGSMPYAQMHYPFENKEKFEANFPAEFIAEGVDQTRAWFYYLHVLGTAIRGSHAFKNVIVNGIVLAEDGKKMSKRLKNYPDPTVVMEQYGADAMRFYLLSSPVMAAENLNFSETGVREALQKNIMILWNVYKFYEMFARDVILSETKNLDDTRDPSAISLRMTNILDRWIVARLWQLIKEVTKNMDAYDLPRAVRPITDFINDLSTWYIRRSRERFKSDDAEDKLNAIRTTRYILAELSKIMAPFTPFLAETIWQKTTGNDFKDENKSVHLESWPEELRLAVALANKAEKEEKILEEMAMVRKIVEMGLAKRDEAGIKVRQPLAEVFVENYNLKKEYENLIKDELNVKDIRVGRDKRKLKVDLNLIITEDLKKEGVKRELTRAINALRKEAGMTIADRAEIYYETDDDVTREIIEEFAEDIMNDTLSAAIKFGVEVAEFNKEVKIDGEIIKLGVSKR